MTARDRAEMAKVRAQLSLANATVHADGVRQRFGLLSPEFAIARAVREEARAALVKVYDHLLAMDRGEVQP